MFSMCDNHRNQFLLFDAIVDHKSDVQATKRVLTKRNGQKYMQKSTADWSLCVRWKDGSTSWERLSDLKESYPAQVAEYAASQGLEKYPAFVWWVPHVLRKRDQIIAAVNKRYHKHTHKFGIEVPKTVKCALEIDKENGNTFWQDAIDQEMKNVRVAFKIMEDGKEAPPGYQYMECHMVFDIKLDGFK